MSDERHNSALADASAVHREDAERSDALNAVRESQHSGSREAGSWIGRELDDRYRVVGLLSEDDTGAVFLAHQVTLERWVAVKVVRGELVGSGDVVIRHAREAMNALRIDHPHVRSAMDCGTLPEGGAYFVMQLVRGISLRRILEDGAISWTRLCEIGAQIADALDAADAAGIVLRDLKPDNVLIEELENGRDHVVVLDFGMAHIAPRRSSALRGHGLPRGATTVATVMGTPGYMAPEQAIGGVVDHRTDLYALGVMLWEAVAGRPLWEGPDAASVTLRQLNEHAPSLRQVSADPTLPLEMEGLVRSLLARSAELRPAHAGDVRDALRDVVDQAPSAVPESHPPSLLSGRRVLAAAGIWIALYLGAHAWVATGETTAKTTPPATRPAIAARTQARLAAPSAAVAGPQAPTESADMPVALPTVGVFVARHDVQPPADTQHVAPATAIAARQREPARGRDERVASVAKQRRDRAVDRIDLAAKRPAIDATPAGAPSPVPAPSPTAEPKPIPATPANVQMRALNVRGSVATSVVKRALERLRPQMQACHAAATSTRPDAPELHVDIEFDERGYSRKTQVAGRGSAALIECVTRAARAIVLDRRPDTGVTRASWTVTYESEAASLP